MTPFPFIAPKTHQEDPRPREDLTETYLDTHTSHTPPYIHAPTHICTNTHILKLLPCKVFGCWGPTMSEIHRGGCGLL